MTEFTPNDISRMFDQFPEGHEYRTPSPKTTTMNKQDIEQSFREGHKKGWLRGADGHSGWENEDAEMYLSTLPKAEGKSMEEILRPYMIVIYDRWAKSDLYVISWDNTLAAMKQVEAEVRAEMQDELSKYKEKYGEL